MALVDYVREGRIGYITFNRPEKLNAFTEPMLAAFDSSLVAFEQDTEARIGILRGAGRAFSVGYDLGRSGPGVGERKGVLEDHARIQAHTDRWLRIWDCPKPVIAQVHGYCIAGGAQVPIFCDIVTIAENAVVGWPKIPHGGAYISPMWAWIVGAHKAKQLSFTIGNEMSGREVHALGWANEVFSESDLESETLAMANQMAMLPPDMLRIKKLAVNRVLDIQGFRTAVQFGAEFDSLLHASPIVEETRRWLLELGIKESIAKFQREGL